MKTFFSVVSALLVLLGAAWLVFPGTMLGRWGVQSDAIGAFVARRYGAMLLGYAVMMWLARTAGPSPARVAILGGGAFVTALVTLLSLGGVLTRAVGPGAWTTVVIEAVLAAGFLYYFLAERRQVQAKPGA